MHGATPPTSSRPVRTRDGILEAMTDGVFVYDAEGFIESCNSAALRLFGFAADDAFLAAGPVERGIRLHLSDRDGHPLPPEKLPTTRLLAGETLLAGDSMDVRITTGSGQHIIANVSGAPLRDASGAITGAVAVYRDVTERHALAQRTQATLHALLAMAESLVDAPIERTEASERRPVATRLAQLTCSVLGCTRVGIVMVEPESLLLRPVAVVGLAPADEAQWWQEQEQSTQRYGEGANPDDLQRFNAGEVFILDMTQPPLDALPNPYGVTTSLVAPMRIGETVVGILSLDFGGEPHVFTEDEKLLAGAVAKLAALVIERERLLDERAATQARVLTLENTTARMDEFLSIASHELRTPLTSIKANVQIAARSMEDFTHTPNGARQDRLARAGKLLARTDTHIERLNRLVNDLLDVSRIHSGKLEIVPQRQDLLRLVYETVEEQRLTVPTRTIRWHSAVATSADLPVLMDADRVRQVVLNFLSNALKYSPEEAPLDVRLEVVGGSARVAVRDEGPGVAPEEQSQIWERFYRAPSVPVASGSGVGLGLGLYISKTIIERLGGTIGVESTPGDGATFWFTLPLAPHVAQ